MKNRTTVLGAALLLAASCATPALADPSGFISASVGKGLVEFDFSGPTQTADGITAEGLASGVYMFTPVLGVQGDVQIGTRSLVDGPNELTMSSIDGALHGFYREADKFLVGGFVQLGTDSFEYNGVEGAYADRAYVGGEAQIFLDSLTLYGQAGMQQFENGYGADSVNLDGWFGMLEARYFLTPDLRIEAHAGLSSLALSLAEITLNSAKVGIGVEYKFENLPVSLFATYDFTTSSFDMAPSITVNEHRFLVGARFALGEESLLDRDRNGASLQPVQPSYAASSFGIR